MLDFVGKEPVHQGTAFNSLSRFCNIAGKSVLEVDGNSDCVAATPFADSGASKVIVTGLYHMDLDNKPSNPLIQTEIADALKLTDIYPDNSFDLVYGISILEHIPNTARFLSQISRVLTKGGMAFLQGAPIWTGPWGHHIHLTPWQNETIGVYQFIPSQILLDKGVNVFNPIPDWGHLLYSHDEIHSLLVNQGVPAQDCSKIISSVFEDGVICRETSSSILEAVKMSGLMVVELEYDRVKIPGEIQRKLRDRHRDRDDYAIMGVRMILRKN